MVTVNATSFVEDEEEKEEEEDQDSVKENEITLKVTVQHSRTELDLKILAILETLPTRIGWRQIFHLPREMCQ